MKNGFLKAVNMFTGNKTKIPVSSPHIVTCPDCNNVDNMSQFSACSYCNGCLDCREPYYRPKLEVLTFSLLLDRFYNYEKLPF